MEGQSLGFRSLCIPPGAWLVSGKGAAEGQSVIHGWPRRWRKTLIWRSRAWAAPRASSWAERRGFDPVRGLTGINCANPSRTAPSRVERIFWWEMNIADQPSASRQSMPPEQPRTGPGKTLEPLDVGCPYSPPAGRPWRFLSCRSVSLFRRSHVLSAGAQNFMNIFLGWERVILWLDEWPESVVGPTNKFVPCQGHKVVAGATPVYSADSMRGSRIGTAEDVLSGS